jgi:hypothetical protein
VARAFGFVAFRQCDPVLVFERIGKFLEIAKQVILPKQGCVDCYAASLNARLRNKILYIGP